MARRAPGLNGRRAQTRQHGMGLEPASVRDAVIEQRHQQRMPQLRERAAERGAFAYRGRIELRHPYLNGLSGREIDRAAVAAMKSFRKEARHPRAAECKKIARDLSGRKHASTPAPEPGVRRNFV